ncbi:MAG: GNAT family N-acetyltransferase [Clostridia bacterium]|nr:GNAT family N-acetyltransferase [Clostridia bacterium]
MKIELKTWTDAEIEAVSDIFNRVDRSYLSNTIPLPYTVECAENWYLNTIAPAEGKTGLARVIYADNQHAGYISINQKIDVYACDAELGYILLDEFKGQGVMTEAVRVFCAEAFEKLNILRISASVYSPNIASQRVLEKNGFIREGAMKNAVSKNGNVYDMYLYGKLK